MRILLAGATGVIGRSVLPLLVADGHVVAGMTRSPSNIDWLRRAGAEPVVCDAFDRQAVIDDGVSRRLTLKKGANVIRAAILNAGGATDFCARFLASEGKPLPGFSVRADSGTSR